MQDHDESPLRYQERNGIGWWEGSPFFYVSIDNFRFKQGRSPLIQIEIEYLDTGKDMLVLEYDSLDKRVNADSPRPGVWKRQLIARRTDYGRWETARFTIDDAFFDNRCNGGDFRIQSRGNIAIRRIEIRAADRSSQIEMAAIIEERNNEQNLVQPFTKTMDDVIAKMKPYDGPVVTDVDRSTVNGKVMAGYQGWFRAPGDGSGRGWVHWGGPGGFRPGSTSVDMWPDVSELDHDEKYATAFRHADGSTAYVFSSMNKKTVVRHFAWMKEAGIDGVFLQRFFAYLSDPIHVYGGYRVIENVREGANTHGRTWAMMYDFSGCRGDEEAFEVFKTEWMRLVDHMKIGRDPNDKAYQHHNGKPLVSLWGLFENRPNMPDFFLKVIDFLQNDPNYGGYSVKIGIENNWRTGESPEYDKIRKAVAKADIVSPWTPGRYRDLESAERFIRTRHIPDMEWANQNDVDFMPVLFPGFSWGNLKGTGFNAIPRLQGHFFWRQVYENINAGAQMIYLAMFDEVDEGTAFFKVSNDPPVGESPFLGYEGLPSDHYMWLAGKARKALNQQIPLVNTPPEREGVTLRPLEELIEAANVREPPHR